MAYNGPPYISTCFYMYLHIYICASIDPYTSYNGPLITYLHVSKLTYIYKYVHLYMYTYVYAAYNGSLFVYLHVSKHNLHIYICASIYLYIYIHSLQCGSPHVCTCF